MKNLHFTQEQVTNILEKIALKENGLQELQKLSQEATMRAEREAFGQGKILELRVPRSRNGHFYPVLLSDALSIYSET